MDYVRRVIDDEIDELFAGLAALAVEGSKAVGKTETAIQRARTVRRLDDPAQAALARADPSPGRFLITGSASPDAPPTHSGAGRIVRLRLRPMSLAERGVERATVRRLARCPERAASGPLRIPGVCELALGTGRLGPTHEPTLVLIG